MSIGVSWHYMGGVLSRLLHHLLNNVKSVDQHVREAVEPSQPESNGTHIACLNAPFSNGS